MTGTAKRRTPNQAPQAATKRAPRRELATVLDQQFDAETLGALRSAILGYATELVGGDTAEEMVLVAHELATNAVRHGGGVGRLRLWVTEGRLWCEVTDHGPGLRHPSFAGTALPAPNAPGGRGLWIARQMSDLTITTTTAGTTITAAIPKS
jgi:anti-sigma regulatory factor (Ser/Thr protein kinase)